MTIFGNNTIGGNSNTVNVSPPSGWLTQFTAGANLTLTQMFSHVGGQAGGNALATMAIYADSGSNTPAARLGICPGVPLVGAVAQAWIMDTLISSVAIVSGTKYWLDMDAINNGGSSGLTINWGALAGSILGLITANTTPATGYSLIGNNDAASIYATDTVLAAAVHNLATLGVGA